MAKTVNVPKVAPETAGLPGLPADLPVTPEEGDLFLTRSQVASKLGISRTEMRRREADGRIHVAKRDAHGWPMFLARDIIAPSGPDAPLSRKSGGNRDTYSADEAAEVFDALDQGLSLIQCVRQCGVHPDVIERIAAAHARLSGGVYLTKKSMDLINVMPLEGILPITSETEMVAVLDTAAKDTCKHCGTRARSICKPCAVKKLKAAEE